MDYHNVEIDSGFPVACEEDMRHVFSQNIPVRIIGEVTWYRVTGKLHAKHSLIELNEEGWEADDPDRREVDFSVDKLEMHPEPLILDFLSSKDKFLTSMARATEREWGLLALTIDHPRCSCKVLKEKGVYAWVDSVLQDFEKSLYYDDDDDGYGPFDSHNFEGMWIEQNHVQTACEIALLGALHHDFIITKGLVHGIINVLKEEKYFYARFVAARLIYALERSMYHDYFEVHEAYSVYAKYILEQFANDENVGALAQETLKMKKG